jgi:hypothetical protein
MEEVNAGDVKKIKMCNGLYRLYHQPSRTFLSGPYDVIEPFDNTYKFSKVRKGKKWGYIDKKGVEIVEAKYDSMLNIPDEEGRVKVRVGENYGYIDLDGKKKEVIDVKYRTITKESDGRCYVTDSTGKIGLIDWDTGEEIVKPQYDEIVPDKKYELSKVRKGKKWGYIDKKGVEIVEAKYDSMLNIPDEEGRVKVRVRENYGYIDLDGKKKEVIDVKYRTITKERDGRCYVTGSTGKIGLIDWKTGTEIVAPIYDEIGQLEQGYIKVKIGNLYGLLNKKYKKTSIEVKWAKIDLTYSTDYKHGACYDADGGFYEFDLKTLSFSPKKD